MLEAIREIGEVILSQGGDEILNEMTVEIELSKSDKTKQHVVIIDINTDTMKASFDVEELKSDSVKKYLWVGNASGPNSPQWRITTDNIGFLCSQALPALCERLKESSLREKIKKIVEQGMTSFSDKVGKRYRYIWDLNRMGIEEGFDAARLEEEISQKNPDGDVGKKLIKCVADSIEGYVRERFNLDKKKDRISLYTLKIDGDLVCQDEGYVGLIYDEKINDIFKGAKEGVCSACGRNAPVTADVRRFKHKYYNTDKPNFSSGVSGDFSKNFSLCADCYKGILVTEVYMRNNLGSNIGSIPLYIIPGFLFKVDMDRESLDEWAKYVNYNFNFAVSFKGMDEFIDGLREYLSYESEGNNYILNLLFYRKNQQEFKILKLIKDVPPSRIKEMIAATSATWETGKKLLGDSRLWSIDLNKIFYLIPQRKKRNELLEVSKLLQIYDGIFSQKPVSKTFLIDKFVELAKIYRLKKFDGYNISAPEGLLEDENRALDRGLVQSMLQCNMMLHYLKILGNLKGGNGMDVDSLSLENHYRDYIREMGYDEQQTAMFLLGCLISEVANAQYKAKLTSKPILDKLTYQGINMMKLIRLTTEVFEKLKQYDILYYNEGIFAQMKKLLDKNVHAWSLTDTENVFYILSGYSYNTYRVLKSKDNKKEDGVNE